MRLLSRFMSVNWPDTNYTHNCPFHLESQWTIFVHNDTFIWHAINLYSNFSRHWWHNKNVFHRLSWQIEVIWQQRHTWHVYVLDPGMWKTLLTNPSGDSDRKQETHFAWPGTVVSGCVYCPVDPVCNTHTGSVLIAPGQSLMTLILPTLAVAYSCLMGGLFSIFGTSVSSSSFYAICTWQNLSKL